MKKLIRWYRTRKARKAIRKMFAEINASTESSAVITADVKITEVGYDH